MVEKAGGQAQDGAASKLAALFRGLARAYGTYNVRGKKNGAAKVTGKALTVRAPVTAALWVKHLAGEQGLGIVPVDDEGRCWFGAIDVDRYDLVIGDVEAQCAAIGLPLMPTRTKSGGVHLYCFAVEIGVPAQLMRLRLQEWSVALGYGGAEIFPKQDKLLSDADVGNWINMPYFGSDKGPTERYGVFKGAPLSLAEYVSRAAGLRVTADQLERMEIPEGEEFERGPPCLQSLARMGFSEKAIGEPPHNVTAFSIGVYLKKRYPNEWEDRLAQYNTQFLRPPLNARELLTLTKSLSRKDYNYQCKQEPIKSFCNRTLCRTRDFGVSGGGKGTEDWGIVIDDDVQRIDTAPPYWIVTCNGVRMQLFSEHFMNQRQFQELCLQKVQLLPPMLTAAKWREEVNRLLQIAVAVPAPPDSSTEGELRWHLQQFCTVYPQAETREEVLTGKPFTHEGFTHFRAADFKRYLDAQHFRAYTGHKLYAEMRVLKVEPKQFWVADQNIVVWAVPVFESTAAIDIPTRVVNKGGM